MVIELFSTLVGSVQNEITETVASVHASFQLITVLNPLPFPISSTSDEQSVGVVRLPSSLFQEEVGPHQRVHDQKQDTEGGEQ